MEPMSQTIPELQTEVRVLQAEVATLQEAREKLCVQRSECRVTVSFPKNNTPEAIAEFHQQNAAFGEQWLQQIQEIDRETQIIEKQLEQKQAVLDYKQGELDKLLAGVHWQQVENDVQTGEKRLQAQARRINQAAAQLEAELQALKALYDQLNPSYSEWFQQPTQIVEFSAKTIPYAVGGSSGLILGNKEIDWEKK
jgi:chromosome segregation ATPase